MVFWTVGGSGFDESIMFLINFRKICKLLSNLQIKMKQNSVYDVMTQVMDNFSNFLP